MVFLTADMKNCDLLNSFAVEEPEMPEEITQHQYRENNAQGRTAQVTHINVCCTESRKHDAIAESKQSRQEEQDPDYVGEGEEKIYKRNKQTCVQVIAMMHNSVAMMAM